MLGIFSLFLSSVEKKSFRNTIRASNGLDTITHPFPPEMGFPFLFDCLLNDHGSNNTSAAALKTEGLVRLRYLCLSLKRSTVDKLSIKLQHPKVSKVRKKAKLCHRDNQVFYLTQ